MKRLLVWLLIVAFGSLPLAASAQTGFNQQGAAKGFHLISAATDNATNIKATPGVVYSIVAINTTTTLYYLKFYDTATTPTCGTTPVSQTYPIPFGASNSGGGFSIQIPTVGLGFNNGIGICVVSGIADNSDGSAATGIAINVIYQ